MRDESYSVVPFVVGITGHRQLADPERLSVDLRNTFEEITRSVPSCRPILMSALAVGADRIAAQVAKDLGWEVVAVLPFAENDPRHRFTTDELRQFYALHAQTKRTIIVGATSNLDRDELHFQAAGQYIASASHVLIAAWDGVDNGAPGGTADIVRFRLSLPSLRTDPVSQEPMLPEWGLTRIIHAARANESRNEPFPDGWYFQLQAVTERRPNHRCTGSALSAFSQMNDLSSKIGVGKEPDELESVFHAADTKATEGASQLRMRWKYCSWLVYTSLISAAVYGDLKQYVEPYLYPPTLLIGYLLSISALGFLVRQIQVDSKEEQPWDWRLLAEAARVLRVWRKIGHVENQPSLSRILSSSRFAPASIIHALRGLSMLPPLRRVDSPDLGALDQWIGEQLRYFDQSIDDASRRVRIRRIEEAALPMGALAALFSLSLGWLLDNEAPIVDYLWFTAGLLPGLGAARLVLTDLYSKSGSSMAANRQRQELIELRKALDADGIEILPAAARVGRLAVHEVCVFHDAARPTVSESKRLI